MAKRKSKANKNDDTALMQEARERKSEGETYWKENYDAGEDDLKFLNGEQWPGQVRQERELEQRPCLTNNVLPTFVDQLLGDQRQNRPSIKVSPVKAVTVPVETEKGVINQELTLGNLDGTEQYNLAECMTAVIRNIEYNCNAEDAYDSAFEATLGSGFSFLRVLSDYKADDSFDQELQIKCIENQFSVTIDPSVKEVDGSDANWVFIEDMMPRAKFKKKYPNATPTPLNGNNDTMTSWFTEKQVAVVEYFTREPVVKEVALMSDGRIIDMDQIKKIGDELAEKNITVKRTRKVKTYRVFWRKITGLEVLEGPVELPWSTIPVVPVWGKKIRIKNKVTYRSLIRFSKDAQRIANYWDSAQTEMVALAPKAPFIGTEEQIEGYEDEWESANTKNHSILPYNPMGPNDPGPRRQPPPAMPSAEMALGMQATDKIKGTLGLFDASLGAAGPEVSGRAILARQRQGDRGSYAFFDNLTKAIRRVGQLLVEGIPYYYDTEQVMRLKFEDDSEDYVKINQAVYDDESGEWVTVHDLGIAKYDVVVRTGPSYQTQRMEAAESMIQFAQAVPSAAAVMADLIAQNMDWPGADVIAERLKKIIPPNVLTNSEREKLAEDMPETDGQPTPEQMVAMEEMKTKQAEEGAKRTKAEADVIVAQQSTIQEQLKTEQAKIKLAEIEAKAADGNQAYEQVREWVAQALAEAMPSA